MPVVSRGRGGPPWAGDAGLPALSGHRVKSQARASPRYRVDYSEPIATDWRSLAANKNSHWKNRSNVIGTSALLYYTSISNIYFFKWF